MEVFILTEMVVKAPIRTEILDLKKAQAETAQAFSERLVKVEGVVEKQESRNQGILYAVIIGCLFIVVTVAVEVIISNKSEATKYDQIFDSLIEMQKDNDDIQYEIELLRAKNPYLK